MADDATPRQHILARLVEWIVGIDTLWQLAIFVAVGAALLAGTLLYQHPEWVTMVLHAMLGTS